MRIAIMQPYFLPYIGYFQLMNAVDIFVFYDDVTFIKQGWINRNRILLHGKDFLFTLELKGASSFKKINTIEVGNKRSKLLKTFRIAYKKAPFFNNIEPLLCSIFESTQCNLSQYIIDSHKLITNYLEINTKFLTSSETEKNNLLKGKDKVLELCANLGANSYINSSGGRGLYSKVDFAKANIKLSFLRSQNIGYKQFTNDFIPGLSIIDVMMFNSVETIREMLNWYELV